MPPLGRATRATDGSTPGPAWGCASPRAIAPPCERVRHHHRRRPWNVARVRTGVARGLATPCPSVPAALMGLSHVSHVARARARRRGAASGSRASGRARPSGQPELLREVLGLGVQAVEIDPAHRLLGQPELRHWSAWSSTRAMTASGLCRRTRRSWRPTAAARRRSSRSGCSPPVCPRTG